MSGPEARRARIVVNIDVPPVHIDFVVDDLDAAVARALQAGAVREGERIDWRGSKCVTFADPFGHGFCLIEFSRDGYE